MAKKMYMMNIKANGRDYGTAYFDSIIKHAMDIRREVKKAYDMFGKENVEVTLGKVPYGDFSYVKERGFTDDQIPSPDAKGKYHGKEYIMPVFDEESLEDAIDDLSDDEEFDEAEDDVELDESYVIDSNLMKWFCDKASAINTDIVRA